MTLWGLLDIGASVAAELAALAHPDALLSDGLGSGPRSDRPELNAWASWKGARISTRRALGEGFSVTSGWQSVAALECLREGRSRQALVSAVGLTQQAIGAVFALEPRIERLDESMRQVSPVEVDADAEARGEDRPEIAA